jgi:hypothetical protein
MPIQIQYPETIKANKEISSVRAALSTFFAIVIESGSAGGFRGFEFL